MTVTWHVDDPKVSHKDTFQFKKFTAYLSSTYEKISRFVVARCMTIWVLDLDYSEDGKVKISMIKYLQKILDYFPEEIGHSEVSTAVDNIFQVIDEDNKMTEFLSE